jgi:hypothetical protein
MATFNLAFHTRLNGVVVLQTFVDTDVQTQDTVTVAGSGHNLNGSHLVISTEPYEYLGQTDEGDLEFDYNATTFLDLLLPAQLATRRLAPGLQIKMF